MRRRLVDNPYLEKEQEFIEAEKHIYDNDPSMSKGPRGINLKYHRNPYIMALKKEVYDVENLFSKVSSKRERMHDGLMDEIERLWNIFERTLEMIEQEKIEELKKYLIGIKKYYSK
jgi:hypothetical protein